MRILQIGADRSRRGIHVSGTPAYMRQKAYAERSGTLDIVGFTLASDPFEDIRDGSLRIHPTRSATKFLYGLNALFVASALPWPDVITVQDPFETGLTGLLISHLIRKPLHVQVHTDFLSPEYARLSLMNRIRRRVAGIVLSHASGVRVVSQKIKDSIQAKYDLHVPITVLPIFVDIKKAASVADEPALRTRFSGYRRKLVYVGRLEKEKHPCLGLRAFAKAAPPDACLIVVGTGSEAEYLRELARELGISDRVFFEGEKESAPYFALADLVLVTSRYEGYGLVIIEALAAGKPVLSTDVGVALEAGAIIAGEEDYATALGKWFQDGPERGRLSGYPYADFDEYVRAYCADLEACITRG